MPVIGKVGASQAKGVNLGPGEPTVFADGVPVSVEMDKCFPHGTAPHNAPVLTIGNPTVRAGLNQEKASVTFDGTPATCGHPLVSIGTVFVNFAISSASLTELIASMGAAQTAFQFGSAEVIGEAGQNLGTVADVIRGS